VLQFIKVIKGIKMNDIVCIGELLIDFICKDIDSDLKDGINFERKAGGAPANVSAAISKLGGSSIFIGKVGNDQFGKFLSEVLKEQGVNISQLKFDDNHMTTLAFVSLQSSGERDFIFNKGASEKLKFDEIDHKLLTKSKIMHFGSATALLGDDHFNTYEELFKLSQNNNIFTSFDPNYREDLWKGRLNDFIAHSKRFISKSDIIKVSEEELELITGLTDKNMSLDELHQLGAKIITVTLGSKGTLLSMNNKREVIDTIKVKSIDSKGAGDAFIGATLFKLSNTDLTKLNFKEMKEIIKFSNKVGAIVCTKLGAIAALPTIDEVNSI
jgi:fructokinase